MERVTTVSVGQVPRRIDVFVSTQTANLSRAAAQRWIDGGLMTVNGRRTKPARLIRPGDVITCHVPVRAPLPVLSFRLTAFCEGPRPRPDRFAQRGLSVPRRAVDPRSRDGG